MCIVFIFCTALILCSKAADITFQWLPDPNNNDLIVISLNIKNFGTLEKCQLMFNLSSDEPSLHNNLYFNMTSTIPSSNIISQFNDELTFFLSLSQCSAEYDFTFVNFQYIHFDIIFTMNVFISYQDLKQKFPIQFNSLQIENYQFTPSSLITSTITEVTISFKANINIDPNNYLLVKIPYHDSELTDPTIPSFNNQAELEDQSINCYGIFKESFITLTCKQNANNLLIKDLPSFHYPAEVISIVIQNFLTPSDKKLYQTELLIYQQFAISSFVSSKSQPTSFQMNQPNNLEFHIYFTTHMAGNTTRAIIQLEIFDLIYSDSIIQITFPEEFNIQDKLSAVQGIYNINLHLIYEQIQNTLILKGQLLDRIYRDSIIIAVDIQNPALVRDYQGFQIQIDQADFQQILTSDSQSVSIKPQTIEMKCELTNPKLGEQSDYCFTMTQLQYITVEGINIFLKLENIEIEFFINVKFSEQCIMSGRENIQASSYCDFFGNKVRIYTPFALINDGSQIERKFCINNLFNPILVFQTTHYQINLMYNNIVQGTNNNNLQLNYRMQDIYVNFVKSTSNITQMPENQLEIQLQFNLEVLQGDQIIINFLEEDFQFTYFQIGQLQVYCKIVQIECQKCEEYFEKCSLYTNFLSISITQNLKEEIEYKFVLQNFISPRSTKIIHQFLVKLYRQNLQISEGSSDKNSMPIFTPRSIKNYNVNFTNFYYGQETELVLQFLLPLCSDFNDQLFIKFTNNINITDLNCKSKQGIINSCQIMDKFLVIKFISQLQAQQYYEISLYPLQNSLHKSISSQIILTWKTLESYLIYEDTIDYFYQFQQQNFESFELIPANYLLNTYTNYTLKFTNQFIISNEFKLELILDADFIISSELICQSEQIHTLNCTNQSNLNKSQIIINFQSIDHKQNIINLAQIKNPRKQTQYKAQLMCKNTLNDEIILVGTTLLKNFQCFENCLSCENHTCLVCSDQWILFNGTCIQNCPWHYVQVGDDCHECEIKNCDLCSAVNPKLCVMCEQGFTIQDDGVCDQQLNIIGNSSNQTSNNSNQDQHSSGEDYHFYQFAFSYFTYLNIIFICTLILKKLINRNLVLLKSFQSYIGIINPIAKIFSIIFFIIAKQYTLSICQLSLFMTQIFQMINFKFLMSHLFMCDSNFVILLKSNSISKIVHFLVLNYDSRLIFIFKSGITKNMTFNWTFINDFDIDNATFSGVLIKLAIISPIQIALLIYAIVTDLQRLNTFQIEYLGYSIFETALLICSLKNSKNTTIQ